ncbi:MAG TPA: 2Fe-2S iron-sulfur cluster-binding protein [Chloroflexia bacterium]|nr:2Fe-2S iron-sulfur cluster-binding protein [Chloroflexia bacterium]
MPRIEAVGFEPFEVPQGTRLVRALEDNGVDILHRCGGFAKCTTCRVEFVEGEPDRMTVAERDRLEAKGVLGEVRLSCQIECTQDMRLRPVNLFSQSDLSDPGPQPEDHITPDPEWIEAPRQRQEVVWDTGQAPLAP